MTSPILALMLQEGSAVERAAGGLTIYSGAFMLISMGIVSLLTIWCFSRVLSTKTHFDPDGTGPARPPRSGEVDPEDVS